jgi:hypothetical protein
MAEDFVEELYNKADVVRKLERMVEYAYKQDGFYLTLLWKEVTPRLAEICADYGRYYGLDTESNDLFQSTMEVVEAGVDIAKIGGTIESKTIPLLKRYFSEYDIDEESSNGRFRIKSTSSGYLTLFDNTRGVYLHSPINPPAEAKTLAEYIYKPEYSEMVILGAGMGYLLYELYELSNQTLKMVVFEDNDEILGYGSLYGVLDKIPEENISYVKGDTPEETVKQFLQYKNEECGKYVNWWYLHNIGNDIVSPYTRAELENESLKESVTERDSNIYLSNYWKNVRNVDKFAYEISKEVALRNEWIVVGGGPSLDDNIEFIRNSMGNKTIIAVTTVFDKLISLGIKPDMIIASEMGKAVFKYIENHLEEKIPLILAPTLYWKYAEYYKGEKYLAPVPSNADMAVRLYKQNIKPWRSGFTVTVLAAEAAIKLGASRIYLVGADFAYPGGFTHAKGAAYRDSTSEKSNKYYVEATNGGKVETTPDLDMFRREMEKLIENSGDVDFINTSKNGAKIKGTKLFSE